MPNQARLESAEIASWIRTKYALDSPETWINVMSMRLLQETQQVHPPVVLEPILKSRHAVVNYVFNSKLEGRLEVNEEGFKIFLRHDLETNPTRHRFTLAHELGHTLFYDLRTSPPRREISRSYRNEFEERLCHQFARTLLMPEEFIRSGLPAFGIDEFENVRQIWT